MSDIIDTLNLTGRRNNGDTNDDPGSVIDTIRANLPSSHKNNQRAVDECVAEDLMKMSLVDRHRVTQEIEGISCMTLTETPEMLDASLANLTTELDAIPFKKKVGFLQSQNLTKTYINDRNFRLRFLRAELFDEREAAVRLVKYCDFVLELFGSFALERYIRLSDFRKNEIKWIQKGYIQLMPFRDKSGRRVILQIMDASILRDRLTRLKFYLFAALVASEDVETQKKGVVLIVWPGGPEKEWTAREFSDSRARHLVTQRHQVVPIRYAGYHYCMPDNQIFRLVRSFAVLYGGLGSGTKSRMRFHTGEDIELRYTLQGYGIPVDFIPVTGTGNIKTNHHKPWMKTRVIIETRAQNDHGVDALGTSMVETIVQCPGSNDVVFKPGKRLMCHPGNVLFESLILSKMEEYNSMSLKKDIYRWLANEIIEKRDGRFLKWNDNGYWTELENDGQLYVKISTACKAVLKKSKTSKKACKSQITIESSTFAFQSINTLTEMNLCDDESYGGSNGRGGNNSRKRSICDCVCGDQFPNSRSDAFQ